MPISPVELRMRLEALAEEWRAWNGPEKEGAQPFVIDLLRCYGVDWKEAGVRFEYRLPSGGVDLLWPGVCLIEMKRPSPTGDCSS